MTQKKKKRAQNFKIENMKILPPKKKEEKRTGPSQQADTNTIQ